LKETVPNIFRYAAAYKRKFNVKSQGLWEMFLEDQPEKTKKTEDTREKTIPNEILQTEAGHQNIEEIDPENMEGEKYNMCHYWSNFEIARLDWFRSKEYNDFFEMMDRSGGFWMERVSAPRLLMDARMLTKIVGRCSYSFTCSRCTSCTQGHPLFPRFRLPAYDHSALPSQRPCSAVSAHTLPGEDNREREGKNRRR